MLACSALCSQARFLLKLDLDRASRESKLAPTVKHEKKATFGDQNGGKKALVLSSLLRACLLLSDGDRSSLKH